MRPIWAWQWNWLGPTKSSSPGNHLEAFAVPNRSLQRKWFLGFVFRWGVFFNNGQGPGYQFSVFLWFNARTAMSTKIFKKNSDILFTLKAFNGRVVLEWLCDEMIQFCQVDGCDNFDPRVYHIATAANLLRKYIYSMFCIFIPGSGSINYSWYHIYLIIFHHI